MTYYLAINTTVAKLADHRVRRALSLAIDREAADPDKVLRTGEATGLQLRAAQHGANYKPGTMDFAAWSEDDRLAEAARLLKDAGYDAKRPH